MDMDNADNFLKSRLSHYQLLWMDDGWQDFHHSPAATPLETQMKSR